MILKPIKTVLTFIGLLLVYSAVGQYLPNPSFEGTPQPHVPPPGWTICTSGWSTPDTQPGNFGVYTPPSHGNTYLGMTTRDDYTWEDVNSALILPLSKDSCYIFKIDLAYTPIVNLLNMQPITLKIYGANSFCNKSNLLWQSPAIGNTEWVTYEFGIQDQAFDITNLILEASYNGTFAYWGYILMDNIRIQNAPKVNLGNDTTLALCDNDSLVLSAGGGFAGYYWNTGSTDSTLEVNTSGTYWVQVFNEYGCSASDTINIVIEEYEDMVSTMIDSTLICAGQEIELFATVENGAEPYQYVWQGFPDTTQSIIVAPDTTSTYVVLVIDKCGNVLNDSIKLVVQSPPPVDIGDNIVICSGGDYTLSAGPNYFSYLWQNGSEDSILVASTPGWYWVQVTSFSGCTNTDSAYLEFFPPIQFSIGEDTTICEDDQLLIEPDQTFVSYLWQDGSTDPEFLAPGPGTYWLQVVDDDGCTAIDTIVIDLSPAETFSFGPDTTVCAGDNFNLSPGPGYASYLWQDGTTNAFMPVTAPGAYWVHIIDAGGCEGGDTINISINPSPVVELGSDTTICKGEVLTLSPGNQFFGYLWQDNSSDPFYDVSATGYYSVTVYNAFNCTASDEILVEVSDPAVDIGPDTIVCAGDQITLNAGQGFASYLWQDGSSQPQYTLDSTGQYFVDVSDEFGCKGTDTLWVEQLPIPKASLGDDIELCQGNDIVLSAEDGPFNYSWNDKPGENSLTVNTEGTYTLKVSNACGTATDQVAVHVTSAPMVNLGKDQVLLEGESIELDAGAGYDTYLWQDGTQTRFYQVSYDMLDADNPFYFVEITDGPCKAGDTIQILLFKVKIPAVFTPNGDLENDVFLPFDEYWNGINSHHMTIFNRWGEKVYETDHFEKGWDGKKDGKTVADGTYFWILEVYYGGDNVKQVLKGTVSLFGS